MPFFSFHLHGDVIVEADDFETALENLESDLRNILSDFEIDSAYGENGETYL